MKPDQLVALYEQLPPARQQLLDEVNFLAGNLRENLVLEQFYLALEALSERLQRLHPASACAGGCSGCCETYALPEVLPMEWELIGEQLAGLAPDVAARLRAQIAAADALDSAGALRGSRRDHPTARCPLLLDGRCAVYAVRPFDCRVTGKSFSTAGERPLPAPYPPPLPGQAVPYACKDEQLRMLGELAEGRHPLEYVFMPQRERLWEALQRIEPSGRGPRLLLQHLKEWSEAKR